MFNSGSLIILGMFAKSKSIRVACFCVWSNGDHTVQGKNSTVFENFFPFLTNKRVELCVAPENFFLCTNFTLMHFNGRFTKTTHS